MLLSQRIWAATLLFLPLVITFGTLVDAVSIPRVALLLVSIALVSFSLLAKEKKDLRRHTQHFFSNSLGISLSLYVLIGLCSTGVALSFSESIWEWLKVFSWLSIIFISAFLLQKKGSLLLFSKASLFPLLLVELIGLKEFIAIIPQLDEDKILYLVNATFEHKNLLATGLVLSLPFSFVVGYKAKEKAWKALAALVMGLAVVLILITQSRAAWLALGGACFFALMGLLLTRSKRKSVLQPRFLAIGGGTLCLSLGLVWLLSSQHQIANAPVKRIQALFTYEDTKNEHTETIQERFSLWNNTLEMIQDAPVLGVGLGNWKIHFPKYSMAGLRSEQGAIFFQRPHNDYLWIASEMGVLGLIAYLGVLLSSLFFAFRILKKTAQEEPSTYAITLAMTSGLVAFLIFSFFDFPKERPVHLLWSGFIIAFISKTYVSLFANKVEQEQKTSILENIVYIFPIIALAGIFFVTQRWQSEYQLKRVLEARKQQQYISVLAGLKQINTSVYELDPSATPIDCYKGEALYLQNRFPEALAAYQAANKVHPYHIHTLNNLATTHFGLQDIPIAKKYFEQVLHFAPHFPGANMNLAAIAYNQKEIEQALAYIGTCAPQSYQDPQFLQFLNAISAAYGKLLMEKEPLKALHPFLQKFAQDQEWQVSLHQKAHQQNKTYKQQIHLDLLFVAQEQKVITETEVKILAPQLN
ncbi:MAG: O-antigen ligase family protein [Aureispira sp.]